MDELKTDDLPDRKWLSDRRVYTINLGETVLGGEPMKNVDEKYFSWQKASWRLKTLEKASLKPGV